MEYEKQVKALRCCAGKNIPGTKCPYYGESWCDNDCLDERLKDTANSIEELMDQAKDKDYLIQQQADEIERLRLDVKKQHEKMIELAKARELKEMEAVKTWCHQRGIAMVDWPIYQSMVACYGRKPKRGKWIDTVTAGIEETVCSVCRCSGFHHFKYCPGCGAMMEVRE